ncbi:MAG TPA: ComEC/Rec2 family competence protein, partial [Rhabdochlamydiaceae bacterium]|nr:ComEC/Rec2 family competence protein [Rhabdochlamydiaceae bacterium]
MKNSPAFHFGLLFFLGVAVSLAFHWSYFIPLTLLFQKERWLKQIVVVLLGVFWAHVSCSLPSLPQEGLECEGRFRIESVSYSHSPFQKSIVYQGLFKNTKCRIYFKEGADRPPANEDLLVKGVLLFKGNNNYVLKLKESKNIPGTHSFADARFKIKNSLRDHLKPFFPDSKNRSFLLSMLTGETDDRLLALEFNRLGLLHLLGISGFQFVILAALFGVFLRLFLPYQLASIGLMLFLTLYAFILGSSPPIERAWVSITLYLIAQLAGKRCSALNALGIALLWQLIKDPLMIFHLGFQFSYLCTAAILLAYPRVKFWLTKIFPDRSFKQALAMPLQSQQGHILLFFCREAVALNLAIHLVTLPLVFFHFHKFPLLSLFYNLFLPAGVSVVYLLLIVGLGFDLMGLGFLIHPITYQLTKAILDIATHPPALYDFQWR